MADVDLYGGDAERIRNQYRQSLGRDASNDEVSGWLSGSYGGGNTDSWLQQIQNSGEAQAYRPPTLGPGADENRALTTSTPPPPSNLPGGPAVDADYFKSLADTYQQYLGRSASSDELSKWFSGEYGYGQGWGNFNQAREAIRTSGEARGRNNGQAATPTYMDTSYWAGQGVKDTDIFNTATGQLNPGWQRTAKGYERIGGTGATGTTGTTSSVPGPQNGQVQPWFTTLMNGKRPSPKTLKEMEPILNQHGIKLGPLNARGFTDGIILPDGTFVDVIIGATEDGGQGWGWITGGGHSGGAPSGMPGTQFNDPHTQYLEKMLQQMIRARMSPVNDPNQQMYEMMLKQRGDALATAEPQLQRLTSYLEERFKDLQGTGYTGAENEAIRTGALDPIESDRQAARKRMMERLSARGLTPDSGIAQQALLEVDKAFDAMRGTTQNTLTINDLNRREDRKVRAQTIGANLVDIPQARAREQLDVFAALNQLSQLARQEDEARQREAMGYGGALADLGPQRLQLAMQAAGMGGNPSSMFGNLMQLAGLNQNAAMYGAQNSASGWSALGSFVETLMRSGR